MENISARKENLFDRSILKGTGLNVCRKPEKIVSRNSDILIRILI